MLGLLHQNKVKAHATTRLVVSKSLELPPLPNIPILHLHHFTLSSSFISFLHFHPNNLSHWHLCVFIPPRPPSNLPLSSIHFLFTSTSQAYWVRRYDCILLTRRIPTLLVTPLSTDAEVSQSEYSSSISHLAKQSYHHPSHPTPCTKFSHQPVFQMVKIPIK